MANRRAFGSIERRKRKDGSYKPGHYAKFVWQGRRYVRSGGPTKAHARDKLDTAHGLLAAQVPIEQVLAEVFGDFDGTRLSFADAVPLYLEYAEKRKRHSTFETDVKRFKVILGYPWTRQYLARIRPDDLTKFVTARLDEGTGPATINRALHLISALYKWAIRMGYVEDNPVRRVEKLREPQGREVYLNATECRTVAEGARGAFRVVVEAAYSTGMRRGEIASLCWPSVDLEAATATVEAANAKTARRRTVPLTVSFLGVLRCLKDARTVWRMDGADPVFVQEDGAPWTDTALRREWERTKATVAARVLAEIADHEASGTPVPQEARAMLDKLKRLRFHDLRHSFASLLVGRGVPLFDVAKLLGHATLAMTMRYAHFQPENSARAATALESALDVLDESHPESHPRGTTGRKSRAVNE
ncbi:MAG: site-specific integrase [Planctomycetota bacterium]